MRYPRVIVCGLLGALSLLCTTLHGLGSAQPAGPGELAPDLKVLLQELQKGPGAMPSPSAPAVPPPASPPVGEYEPALLRYRNLQEMTAQNAGNRAAELARQLQELEAHLAAIAKASPPQPAEPPSALPPPERASEGSVAGSRLATPPAQVTPPVPQVAADDYGDYDRLAQRLEDQAAALRAMARQLRGVAR
jgi:hypothetical protein